MTINQLVVATYKQRLDDACPGAAERMLKADADNGEKLAGRAKAYEAVVRSVINVLEREGLLVTA